MVSARSSGSVATPSKQKRILAPGPDGRELDPYTRFLYTPHTITCLIAASLALIYFSHSFDPERSPPDAAAAAALGYENAKRGVWGAVCAYLIYGVIQGPSTNLIRPHPAFWRLVHGIGVCYLLLMVYLLFQTVDDGRLFFRHFYPELGVHLPERHYGDACALRLPASQGGGVAWGNLRDTLFDEFVAAHIIGWWGKALMLRDRTLLWVISVTFELMELTFRHWLPNFNECWWDSWILDVAICNALGIALGMRTVAYFESKTYDWRGLSRQPGLMAMLRRAAAQFTPQRYAGFVWRPTSSPKRLLQCLFPVAFFLLFEVNHFFLKYVFWIPPRNPLNTYRLVFLLGLGLPGMREWYEFMEGTAAGDADKPVRRSAQPTISKLGPFCWLGMAVALVETLVVIKYGRGEFTAPWPTHVVVGWGIFFALNGSAFAVWCYRYYVKGERAVPVVSRKDA